MDEKCNSASFGLNEEEISFAVTLAHTLKEENVDQFLEIYDSIPASLETKRIELIKDMARQLAALPRIPKQYELYRSRKFLASESFLAVNVGNKCLNGRRDTEVNTCTEKEEQKSKIKHPALKCFEDKDEADKVVDTNILHQCHGSRKKRKGKKAKAGNNELICQPMVLDNLKAEECDEELKNKARSKSSELADKSPCESDYYSAEGGCLPSPAISDSPPFGFPLSPERLFESAISLLSKHDGAEQSSSTCVTSASNPLHEPEPSINITLNLACKNFDPASTSSNKAQDNSKKGSSKKDTEIDVIIKKSMSKLQLDEQENRQEADFNKSVGNAKSVLENEVVKTDISTLELDEQGWQSQTKRHRKKKKDNILKIAPNRDKHNNYFNSKSLKKDGNFNNPGQHNIKLGNNDNYKKKWGNKHYRTNRAASNCKDFEEKCHRWINGENPDTASRCMEELTVATEAISGEGEKFVPSDNQHSRPKFLSYRDALLKSKSKEDLHYSSDSGVDASSVSSSCDSVVPQLELPCYPPHDAGVVSQYCSAKAGATSGSDTGIYNHAEVAKYLWETWTVIQEKYKRGLVVRYNDRREVTGQQYHAKFKSPGWGQRYRKGKVY